MILEYFERSLECPRHNFNARFQKSCHNLTEACNERATEQSRVYLADVQHSSSLSSVVTAHEGVSNHTFHEREERDCVMLGKDDVPCPPGGDDDHHDSNRVRDRSALAEELIDCERSNDNDNYNCGDIIVQYDDYDDLDEEEDNDENENENESESENDDDGSSGRRESDEEVSQEDLTDDPDFDLSSSSKGTHSRGDRYFVFHLHSVQRALNGEGAGTTLQFKDRCQKKSVKGLHESIRTFLYMVARDVLGQHRCMSLEDARTGSKNFVQVMSTGRWPFRKVQPSLSTTVSLFYNVSTFLIEVLLPATVSSSGRSVKHVTLSDLLLTLTEASWNDVYAWLLAMPTPVQLQKRKETPSTSYTVFRVFSQFFNYIMMADILEHWIPQTEHDERTRKEESVTRRLCHFQVSIGLFIDRHRRNAKSQKAENARMRTAAMDPSHGAARCATSWMEFRQSDLAGIVAASDLLNCLKRVYDDMCGTDSRKAAAAADWRKPMATCMALFGHPENGAPPLVQFTPMQSKALRKATVFAMVNFLPNRRIEGSAYTLSDVSIPVGAESAGEMKRLYTDLKCGVPPLSNEFDDGGFMPALKSSSMKKHFKPVSVRSVNGNKSRLPSTHYLDYGMPGSLIDLSVLLFVWCHTDRLRYAQGRAVEPKNMASSAQNPFVFPMPMTRNKHALHVSKEVSSILSNFYGGGAVSMNVARRLQATVISQLKLNAVQSGTDREFTDSVMAGLSFLSGRKPETTREYVTSTLYAAWGRTTNDEFRTLVSKDIDTAAPSLQKAASLFDCAVPSFLLSCADNAHFHREGTHRSVNAFICFSTLDVTTYDIRTAKVRIVYYVQLSNHHTLSRMTKGAIEALARADPKLGEKLLELADLHDISWTRRFPGDLQILAPFLVEVYKRYSTLLVDSIPQPNWYKISTDRLCHKIIDELDAHGRAHSYGWVCTISLTFSFNLLVCVDWCLCVNISAVCISPGTVCFVHNVRYVSVFVVVCH